MEIERIARYDATAPTEKASFGPETMKQLCICLVGLILAGCSTGQTPPQQTEISRQDREQMRQADKHLVEQFKKITVGMSPAQVREIMRGEPQTRSGNVWAFKLSPASDTPSEIDWLLLVKFDKDKVTASQTVFTCLYPTEKQ